MLPFIEVENPEDLVELPISNSYVLNEARLVTYIIYEDGEEVEVWGWLEEND